jgi:hypothetical protein
LLRVEFEYIAGERRFIDEFVEFSEYADELEHRRGGGENNLASSAKTSVLCGTFK